MTSDAENSLSKAISEIKSILQERLTTARPVLEQHGKDESFHTPSRYPDAVAYVRSTEEVSQVVSICSKYKIPVIPFGAGSSLEGHLMAVNGGISVDLNEMKSIISVNDEDMDTTVQPGVTREELSQHLRHSGLFFPVDPGAEASLGGMVATKASGTNAVRYGTMAENTLSLTVVLANGKIIKTGTRSRKSAAGYDLTRLFVGSEGTLGIVTEITLRLYGLPEGLSAAFCQFDQIGDAVNTVIETMQLGIPVARIELLDDLQIKAINGYSKTDFPEKNSLFLEFHGTPDSTKENACQVGELVEHNNGSDFQWASNEEERNKLWAARHSAGYAAKSLRPGCEMWPTDVCVPISKLADCIVETKQDLKDSFLIAPIVGHVGDGNFHLVLLINPEDPREIEEAERINDRLIERALSMEGTCTGEHGIGLGKMSALKKELGADCIELMRSIKLAVDPDNIMNPGKIFYG